MNGNFETNMEGMLESGGGVKLMVKQTRCTHARKVIWSMSGGIPVEAGGCVSESLNVSGGISVYCCGEI